MGITGARDSVGSQAAALVSRVREYTGLPVAVGLGVRDGAQAREVGGFADGVIVGSAFVARMLAADSPAAGVAAVADLAAELAAGVRAAARPTERDGAPAQHA
jgi:tryptophan synthase alpha chain